MHLAQFLLLNRVDEEVLTHAQGLLGRALSAHGVVAVITEVEAYGGINDPASHAYTRTPRSEIMYGPPWRLYVYRSYGMHWAANIVTGPQSQAGAVLLRSARVIDGLETAKSRRGSHIKDHELARGPGNLARALGITDGDLGSDVLDSRSAVHLLDHVERPARIESGPRVGISKAADWPWRLWIEGETSVSAYRRNPRAIGENEHESPKEKL